MKIGKGLLAVISFVLSVLGSIIDYVDDHRHNKLVRGFVATFFVGAIIVGLATIGWTLITYKFIGFSWIVLTLIVALLLFYGAKKVHQAAPDRDRFGVRLTAASVAFFVFLLSFSVIFAGLFSNQLYAGIFAQGAASRNSAFNTQATANASQQMHLQATITAQSGTIHVQGTALAQATATISAQHEKIITLQQALDKAQKDAQNTENLINCPTVKPEPIQITSQQPVILLANSLTKNSPRACIVVVDNNNIPYYWTTNTSTAQAVILPELAGYRVVRAMGYSPFATQQQAISQACSSTPHNAINLFNNELPQCA